MALALDNLGSGAFLPLTVLYLTRVAGLSLAVAGTVLGAATALGLLVPVVVSAVIDRVGPRRLVLLSQLVQGLAMLAYLTAGVLGTRGAAPGLVVATAGGAALLGAAGTQVFYSSLFTLVGATAPAGARDRPFAQVEAVRSGAFGLGALLAAGAVATGAGAGLVAAVVGNAASFVVAATVLTRVGVDPVPVARPGPERPVPPWRHRPFLLLLLVILLTGLATDVFLLGFAVFAVEGLRVAAWLPGVAVALLTAVSAAGTLAVVRLTRTWARTVTVGVGTVLLLGWAVSLVLAPVLPPGLRPAWLLAGAVVLAVAGLFVGTRVLTMAEATAPAAARGRYLATVQYAFNAAQVLAPALVALLAVRPWLPWAAVALAALVALLLLPWLHRILPTAAVRPPDDVGRNP